MSQRLPATESARSQSLPVGTGLEEFVIESVLGSGGFGITYLARDRRLGRKVVIKENLPAQFCFRDVSSLTVSPRHSHGEDAENFAYSLESFEKEAAMLASLDHPGIVKVLRSFEAHGTAYFVMPFVEGTALDDLLKQGKRFEQGELQALLQKLLAALGYLHERGIYHRDIKPGNILITAATGEPVLIDFGAARQRLGEKSLTVIESAGYTPFEQLQTRGKVGPWSDIYALGATLYKLLTGETPPKAADRVLEDPMGALGEGPEILERYSRRLLESIDKAMSPRATDRFQNAVEWRDWVLKSGRLAQPESIESRTSSVSAAMSEAEIEKRARELAAKLVAEASDQTTARRTHVRSTPMDSGAPNATKSGNGFTNSLGMKFVPVRGTSVLMCIHQTRNVDYSAYAATNKRVNRQWIEEASSGKENHPVVYVSYDDAEGFCRWLSAKEGRIYRLPSDSEWSAAVGLRYEQGRTPADKKQNGLEDIFPWGNYYPPQRGDGNFGKGLVNGTARVMSYRANEQGIFDLSGNVYEWCQDWYDDNRDYRVLRGSSWVTDSRKQLRSSYRGLSSPSLRCVGYGFRCVLVVPDGRSWDFLPAPTVHQDSQRPMDEANAKPEAIKDSFLALNGGDMIVLGPQTKMQMVFIKPGSFTMGSPTDERGRSTDESQAEVTLSAPFWLAKTEVTQAQWEAVMGANPSHFKSPNLPVENVSWDDAQSFLAKLNEKGILPEGWKFALPTEAQWEYACRAGEKGPYSGGSLEEVGWYDRNSGSKTHEVGQKKPNAWGLHDMQGNVWEWCADWYDDTLKGGVDPTGPSSGDYRVYRGGSWFNDASRCRAAYRRRNFPGGRRFNLGFRPALVPSR
jgi:formylglycine-generating enzyme required for sulfatase activity